MFVSPTHLYICLSVIIPTNQHSSIITIVSYCNVIKLTTPHLEVLTAPDRNPTNYAFRKPVWPLIQKRYNFSTRTLTLWASQTSWHLFYSMRWKVKFSKVTIYIWIGPVHMTHAALSDEYLNATSHITETSRGSQITHQRWNMKNSFWHVHYLSLIWIVFSVKLQTEEQLKKK